MKVGQGSNWGCSAKEKKKDITLGDKTGNNAD
jgi:hypothetical protein